MKKVLGFASRYDTITDDKIHNIMHAKKITDNQREKTIFIFVRHATMATHSNMCSPKILLLIPFTFRFHDCFSTNSSDNLLRNLLLISCCDKSTTTTIANQKLYPTTEFTNGRLNHITIKRRKKPYFIARINCNPDTVASFQLMRLTHCGDNQPNARPKSKSDEKPKCNNCCRTIAKNHPVVVCASCQLHYHMKCANITPVDYDSMVNEQTEIISSWLCTLCHLSDLPTNLDIFEEPLDYTSTIPYSQSMMIQAQATQEQTSSLDWKNTLGKKASSEVQICQQHFQQIHRNVRMDRQIRHFQYSRNKNREILSKLPILILKATTCFVKIAKRAVEECHCMSETRFQLIKSRSTVKIEVESILVDVILDQRDFPLLSAYKPPSVNNETLTRELTVASRHSDVKPHRQCILSWRPKLRPTPFAT